MYVAVEVIFMFGILFLIAYLTCCGVFVDSLFCEGVE